MEKGWVKRKSAFGPGPNKAEIPPGRVPPEHIYWEASVLKPVMPWHCILTSVPCICVVSLKVETFSLSHPRSVVPCPWFWGLPEVS